MRPCILLAISACACAADIGGLGEDPVPNSGSQAWLYWQNDGFGPSFGRDCDDFRSNAIGLGLRIWHLVIGADLSLLTESNPSRSRPDWGLEDPFARMEEGQRRVDELTLSAAWRIAGDRWEVRLGPGMRATGDLGGQELQERTHTLLGQPVLNYPYEDDSIAWDGLGYARVGGTVPLAGPVGFAVRAIGLATTGDEYQAQASATLIASGPGGAWWFGLDQQFRRGNPQTSTQARVGEEEEGAWVAAGFSASLPPIRLSFSGARNWSTNGQMGVLGISLDPPGANNNAGWRVEAEAGFIPRTASGDGRGQQYRLLAASHDWAAGIWAFADVQDIACEPPMHRDLTGRRQQVAAGVRWELTGSQGFHPVLGADAAVGFCQARLMDVGWTTIEGEEERIENAAALHGGPFAGLGWTGESGRSLAVIAALDGFLPFRRETVELETLDPRLLYTVKTDPYDLLRPDIAYVLRVRAAVVW